MILRRPVMDIEGWSPGNQIKKDSWRTVLALAYQSLGVVYGDLSTSPLYVYKSTFAEDIHHSESNEEIFGVLSFVFWTLTLIPLIKYVFIVLRADDNGEGGTFALYSLLCRHARVSILPNGQLADEDLYEYKKEGNKSNNNRGLALKLRSILEKYRFLQKILLTLALIGTCMVIGDGVLTPAISVFSAVSGLELVVSKHHHHYIELPVTCMILVFLFYLQHYGTHRIGFLFAPIVITWLFCISAIGVYNIFHWNPHVYQALSPYYMYKFLRKTQKRGWMSLGGILLCITGSEAMFADLGHFSQLSIKIAFTCAVYPSLILAYMGQAAYLSKHHIIESDYQIGFYVSVPENLRWPVLAIAILAAVVGSQAIITGTFSIIKQCCALGCFPRVKIIHTSSKICGQIYIPEINWTLMLLCLAVTIGFRNTKHISNASGLAVITVMLVTTCLMSLVIILCWNKSVLLAICFILFFGSIELLYFSASLIKFLEGAWVPLALSFIFLVIMFVWHYGTLKKYEFDVQNKVPLNWLLSLGPTLGIVRVRGIGLIHTQLVSGIPAIFSHFVTNLPAFHQVLVLFCIKYVPVPHVRPEERFLVGRVGPKEYRVYRVIARYGYHDVILDDVEFERDLVCSIAEFIRSDGPDPRTSPSDGPNSKYNSSIMIDGASPELSPLDRPGPEFSLTRGSPPQHNNLTWSDGPSIESSHLEHNGSIWSGQPSPKLSPSGEPGTDHNSIIISDGLCSEFSPTGRPHPKFNGDDEKMAVIGTTSTLTKGMIETWDNDDDDEKIPFRETGPTEMGKVDKKKRVRFRVPEGREMDRGTRAEMQELMEAREAGMAFILGHCYVRAKSGSGFIKRIAINVLYDFLRRNSTSPTYAASFPRASTLEVGMIYHV